MKIFTYNGIRFNPYQNLAGTGISFSDLVEIEVANPPIDFDSQFWNIKELDVSPYVLYEKKPQSEINKIVDTQNLQKAQKHLLDTDYLFYADRNMMLQRDEPQRYVTLSQSREQARNTIREFKLKYPERFL